MFSGDKQGSDEHVCVAVLMKFCTIVCCLNETLVIVSIQTENQPEKNCGPGTRRLYYSPKHSVEFLLVLPDSLWALLDSLVPCEAKGVDTT